MHKVREEKGEGLEEVVREGREGAGVRVGRLEDWRRRNRKE